MTDKACYLCGDSHIYDTGHRARDNRTLRVLRCLNCSLTFLSSTDHIPDDHYKKSGMHESRPVTLADWREYAAPEDLRRYNAIRDKVQGAEVLDVGCGTGGFLLKLKDGYNTRTAIGVEPELSLQNYFEQMGLEVYTDIQSIPEDMRFDFITMFQVLEHIKDPISFLREYSKKLKKGGRITVEVPNVDDALLTIYNSKAFADFTHWSQHLYSFSESTLLRVAKVAGLYPVSVKQIQRYPVANHLHWLATGQPGGHEVFSVINHEELNKQYERTLASIGRCDTISIDLEIR